MLHLINYSGILSEKLDGIEVITGVTVFPDGRDCLSKSTWHMLFTQEKAPAQNFLFPPVLSPVLLLLFYPDSNQSCQTVSFPIPSHACRIPVTS